MDFQIKNRFFLHAVNIHQGGGRVLLQALLEAIPSSIDVVAIIDSRMTLPEPMSERINVIRVRPSIAERLKAELWLHRNVSTNDRVLCFGNLPPLLKLRGYTAVFLQNRYLIDKVPLNQFSLNVRIRLEIERRWLVGRAANANEFIVQTPSMKMLLEHTVGRELLVRTLPFVMNPGEFTRALEIEGGRNAKRARFLYVASGEPHKNHGNLIKAWVILAEQGFFPSLSLSVDDVRFSSLCRLIEEARLQHGLMIDNLGLVPYEDILPLYGNVDALIYPSTFESFGLPLIEARQAGLPILAGELDYVRDLIEPEETFDPASPRSIARAVKRFLGVNNESSSLLSAKDMLQNIKWSMQ